MSEFAHLVRFQTTRLYLKLLGVLMLSQIWIYPVKSLRGIALSAAKIDAMGLEFDRRWMVVDSNGQMLTQRKHGVMAQIETEIETRISHDLTLSHRGQSVRIPLETEGPRVDSSVWHDTVSSADCGQEAAQFLSEILRQNVRLVWMNHEARRFVDGTWARNGEVTSFADGFPFLILGEASVADLNDRILENGSQERIEIERFRPNFAFKGGAPLDEETWDEFSIGEARFRAVKPCSRCAIVNLDPVSGEKTGGEPLKTLRDYRKFGAAVYLGQNVLTQSVGATIRVGDEIRVWSRKAAFNAL